MPLSTPMLESPGKNFNDAKRQYMEQLAPQAVA